MSDKPVAQVIEYTMSGMPHWRIESLTHLPDGTLLYTKPSKQLSDEEIKRIAFHFEEVYSAHYDKKEDMNILGTRYNMIGFARAIIKANRGEE